MAGAVAGSTIEGEAQCEEEGGDLDLEEEMNFWAKTLETVRRKRGKATTTTKSIDRVQEDDDGKECAWCRLVARDFKPRCVGPRDDLFAAVPPGARGESASFTSL